MSKNLSQTQQDLFDAMRRGVVVHHMPYMGRLNPSAYYFRDDTNKRCTSAALALISKGIAESRGRHDNKTLVLKEGVVP